MNSNRLSVAVLGASGFVGMEMVRLLAKHPVFELGFISSETYDGLLLKKVFVPKAALGRRYEQLQFGKIEAFGGADMVFSCLSNGILPRHLDTLAKRAERIFNLAGDYRFRNPEQLQKHYPESARGPWPESHQFFIPEFDAIQPGTKLVNLPGCMAAATMYALYPLLKEDLLTVDIVADVKTGSSGSGKAAKELASERANNLRPYKLHGHRHQPEILEALQQRCGRDFHLGFGVHSLPLARGVFVTTYSRLKEKVSALDVKKAFYRHYGNKRFINLVSADARFPYPMIKTVIGTNNCELGHSVEGNSCIVVSAIDNLIKGAAGQAIQAANLFNGLDEALGLDLSGIWP